MRPFEELSRAGGRRRLGALGKAALAAYGIADARLTFQSDTENTVFRVDAAGRRYALRIHRPGHRSPAELMAELRWLAALREEAGLPVPEPVPTLGGGLIHEHDLPGVPGPRQVVLFRWVEGRLLGEGVTPPLMRQLGALMARLHDHAVRFSLPEGCARDRDDWHGMGRWPAEQVGALLSADEHRLCAEAVARVVAVIEQAPTAHDYGLIHSDLHLWNCLVHAGRLGAIDFDDCQIAPFSSDIAITLSYVDQRPDSEVLRAAFFQGYTDVRPLPAGHAGQIEAFMVDRGLRMICWVASWPSVDHFPFGRGVLDAGLRRARRYLDRPVLST